MSSLRNLLVIWLLLCPSTSILVAEPSADATRLVGTWELVGVGDDTGNVTTPKRFVISFLASGECYVRIWEHGRLKPDEALYDFVLTNGVLELTPRTFGALESFRLDWDTWMLVLEPLDDPPRHPLPLRFEKRAWAMP